MDLGVREGCGVIDESWDELLSLVATAGLWTCVVGQSCVAVAMDTCFVNGSTPTWPLALLLAIAGCPAADEHRHRWSRSSH